MYNNRGIFKLWYINVMEHYDSIKKDKYEEYRDTCKGHYEIMQTEQKK